MRPERSSEASAPRIREFLYLDFPKLTSYLAQLSDGNTLEKRVMQGLTTRDLTKDPTKETSVSGSARVSAGEGTGLEFSIPKLLGLLASIDTKLSQRTVQGGDEFEMSDAHFQVATKELHHEIFNLVEGHLIANGLVGHDTKIDSTLPFHTVTGPADLLDFSHLAGAVRDWKKFGSNFATLTGQENFAASMKNPRELGDLIGQFYGGRLGLVVHGGASTVTAYLQEAHLTVPASAIVDNYGRFTQVDLTVFGLHVGETYPSAETDGELPFLELAEQIAPIQRLGQMASQIIKVNRSLEALDRFFRVRGGHHLFPIAVYLDFGLGD